MASITYLRVDKSKQRSVRITVQGSGDAPSCFRGNAQTYRVAVFDPAGAVLDLSDHSSLNLAYMPTSRTAAAIASKTDAIVNATFTEAQWEAGTHYHAEFVFEEADMNPSLDGSLTKSFWMVCYGILTSTGEEDTHGGCTFTIEEDGTANTVTSPSAPAVGITGAQAEALIAAAALLQDGTEAGTAMQELLGLNFTDPTELTIATGAITATQSFHTVDTEADAASDDLTTITAAKGVGDMLILVPANDARSIVIKHGTGNIATFNGADITLDTDDHWAILMRIDTRWVVMSNSGSGATYLANLVEDTTPQLGGVLDANGKQIREAAGASVASASSLSLGNDGNYFSVTGTTTITSIATKAVGTRVTLRFAAALTLTHHATDLILPGGANITTAAGDVASFVEYASGDWVCISYVRASGLPIVNPTALTDIVQDTTPQLGGPLDANAKQIREAKGADVASSSALSLGNDGNYFVITGTTTITSIGTKAVGTRVTLRFAGALTLTHHATDLILPTGASITTAAGDVASFVEYAAGDWVCVSYQRANGQSLAAASGVSPYPTATVTKSSSDGVYSSDQGKILLVDTTSADVTITVGTGGITGHFWIRHETGANDLIMDVDGGRTLEVNGSAAPVTLTPDVTYHFYEESTNNWRLLSKS